MGTPNPPPGLPIVSLIAGDSAVVPTRNPLQSTVIWGIVVGMVAAFLRKHLPADYQNYAADLALEICQYGLSSAMILYGRWHAKQPLGIVDDVKQVTMKCLLPLLLLISIASTSSGCQQLGQVFGTMPTAEHAVWREAVDQSAGVMLDEHLAWAHQLHDTGGTLTLPELQQMTPAQRDNWLLGRTAPIEEYKAGLEEDRARYTAPPSSTPPLPAPSPVPAPATQPIPADRPLVQ